MSEDPNNYDGEPDPSTSPVEDVAVLEAQELEALKAKADLMGIKYHPSIGLEKLREKLVMVSDADVAQAEAAAEPQPESPEAARLRLMREATRLRRIRVTCMNPAKVEWEGEIISAGNSIVGMIKKYVPFEREWHVPEIIYNVLQERMYQTFYTVTNPRTGQKGRKGKLVKEFAIEELPQLTADELKALAQRQAMAAGADI